MAGIYIHIPFCVSRCIYCGFYSTLVSNNDKIRLNITDSYTDALCKEIEDRKFFLLNKNIDKFPIINTIYFGGGTPSVLSYKQLEKILNQIFITYSKYLSDTLEITLECNPDDVSIEWVKHLKLVPINRISMGAQTFNDKRLQFLKRRHKASDLKTAINRLHSIGINNISVDLMFGFPEETLEEWAYDIDCLLELNVEHISAYSLMYEEGTPLFKMLQQDKVREIDEELYRKMYSILLNKLSTAGYEHYEISNFARLDGYNKSIFRSQHNSSYWKDKPYLGIGAAAHSYNNIIRSWNIADIHKYIYNINNNICYSESEVIDARTHYNDLVTTQLRTCEGLDTKKLSVKYRNYIMQNAKPLIEQGYLQLEQGFLQLTHSGIYLSDSIMSDLIMID